MTELDKKLQEMATKNWDQFAMFIGEDAIRSAKICLLRQNNFSYGEIVVKLGVTKDQAAYACGKCDVIAPAPSKV
jgi:hypothetical protein